MLLCHRLKPDTFEQYKVETLYALILNIQQGSISPD